MSTRAEGGLSVFATPPYSPKQYVPHPAEMLIAEQANGNLTVYDPLLENPYRFGDRSLVRDPIADDFVVAHWQYHGIHGSTRQLSNTEPFETKVGTGRWSRMQHMLSAAALAAHFDGTPEQIMFMAIHDTGHRLGSHRTDDLLDGRGHENAHDKSLATLFQRNGFMTHLIQTGLLDEQTMQFGNGVSYEAIVQGPQTRSFINQPSATGLLENERLQYILHEGSIWIESPSVYRQALQHVQRYPDSPEGDVLVFNDIDAAEVTAIAQTRCFSEHWSDAVNDIVDELLSSVGIRLLNDDRAGLMQYSPADTMYILEEDWEHYYHQGSNEGTQHFIASMLKIINPLTALQRRAHAQFNSHHNRYNGPILPDWLSIIPTLDRTAGHRQRTTHHKHAQTRQNQLVLQMAPGKKRFINPLVKLPHRDFVRLENARPSIKAYREQQTQWTGSSYDAIIDLDHPALALTASDKQIISRVLNQQDTKISDMLQRPPMPTDAFTHQFQAAAARYRQLGLVAVEVPEITVERALQLF